MLIENRGAFFDSITQISKRVIERELDHMVVHSSLNV